MPRLSVRSALLGVGAAALIVPMTGSASAAVVRPAHQPGVRPAAVQDYSRHRSSTLATHIPVGAGIDVGGFSDLYPRDDSGTHFWTITDRGPNYDRDDGQGFVVPSYTPRILAIDVHGSRMVITKQILLRLPRGVADPVTGSSYVTGLPNIGTDSPPFDTAGDPLPVDPYGVDIEGMVAAPDGTFWLSEEYRPSVLHVAADGTILSRLVPAGEDYSAPGIDVQPVLPGILSLEKSNRGLEGLTISGDGRTLYAAMQSPLNNPSSKSSRNLRIVALDISHPRSPRTIAEYLNIRDANSADDGDWETSALVWLGTGTLLVEERDGENPTVHTDYYAVDLSAATNLLGTRWDDPATSPTLESLTPDELAAAGVVAGAKRLVFDAHAAGVDNGKLEGAAITPAGGKVALSLVNDNDFDVDGIDADGNVVLTDTPEQLDTYFLPQVQVYGTTP